MTLETLNAIMSTEYTDADGKQLDGQGLTDARFQAILALHPLDAHGDFHYDLSSDVATKLVDLRFFSWIDVERKRIL